VRLLLAWALAAATLHAQQVTPVQVPDGAVLMDMVYADVNGDGLSDLVLSTTESGRALTIHLQRKSGARFVSKPDYRLAPVYKDAVAFAVADVHADPGAEVVIFSARGVFAWRPKGPEKERTVRIATCDFLWQLPHRTPFAWPEALVDLDHDGLVDIVVPEPDGYRILRQTTRGEFATPQRIIVPAGPEIPDPQELSSSTRRTRMLSKYSARVTIGGGGELVADYNSTLVDVSDRLPAPQWRDWNADGDLDLIIRTAERLYVWAQDGQGRFPTRPTVDLKMPVVADRKRRIDVSYSAHVIDLDRDRRADCVIFSGDQRSKAVRTQIQFFAQRGGKPLFGERGLPDQLLVLGGFAGLPRFDDVNGDGYPDLFSIAVRPDLFDTIKGGAKHHLDAEIYVFLNRKGRFPRKPDLLHRTKIQVEGMKPRRGETIVRFFGDVTGDGVRDLLLRDSASRLKVLMVRRSGEGIKVLDKALYEVRIDEDARIRVGPERGRRKAPDVIVLERRQALHVRFN